LRSFELAWSGRLDNRRELAVQLGLESAAPEGAVVLRAYERFGEAFPEHLLGDFSLVVRDRAGGTAFAACDPFGARPLHYRIAGGEIAFASRARDLASAPGERPDLDTAALAEALVPELEGSRPEGSAFRGVARLPAAHRLVHRDGRVEVSRYWSPDALREIRLGRAEEYVEAFRAVFAEAVRCRLGPSTGSMLSGGLDSSSIVGYARAARGGPLTTLSATTDDPACEESRHVSAVAQLPGLDPVRVRPSDLRSFDADLDRFFDALEDPIDATMVVPALMYASARRRGLTSVLDGVDGDAVASHEPGLLASLLRSGAWIAALREGRALARFYRESYPPWGSASRLIARHAVRAFAPESARGPVRRLRARRRAAAVISASLAGRDFARQAGLAERLQDLWTLRAHPGGTSARARHASELVHPHLTAAVARYHRVAAAFGIEARHPFLDRRVVELCLSMPWDRLMRDGWSKRIVREAGAGLLPDDVLWRRGRWVRLGPLFLARHVESRKAALLRDLEGDIATLATFVDAEKVRRAAARYRDGADADVGETMWQLNRLATWVRREGDSRYDAAPRDSGAEPVARCSAAGRSNP